MSNNNHLTEEEKRLRDTPNAPQPRNGKAIAVLTPEQLTQQVKTQVGVVGNEVGDEMAGTIALVVGEQIALNVIQKLPDAIAHSGGLLKDFFTGVDKSEVNPFLPQSRITQFLPTTTEA